MKERNIKLSLEKAREFYSKGGELKDLALSAFTKEEILMSKLPKTWEEFCKNYPYKCGVGYYIDNKSNIVRCALANGRDTEYDRNLLPSKKAAEQHLALMQLHQLRDCYRQGWIPDFNNNEIKYHIYKKYKNGIIVDYITNHNKFLSFKTKELAEEFLYNFRDLIVQAGDLI